MLEARNIIHINDFDFKNNQPIKGRYFIVLDENEETSLVLSVVTSQNFIPDDIFKQGCIDKPELNIHSYVFTSSTEIGENGFKFSKDSFIYIQSSTVYEQDLSKLLAVYPEESIDIKDRMNQSEYEDLIYCVYKSKKISKKIKVRMTAILENIQ